MGDFLTHLPLPAKITVQVLDPINLQERYGPHPEVDAVAADVVGEMQGCLDELAAARRLPVLG